MRTNDISAAGLVDNQGKLRMDMSELNEFLKAHKGERIIARFVVAPIQSSDALKGYYFHYIVPTVRNALKEVGELKTDEETDFFLRELCPLCHVQWYEGGKFGDRVSRILELSDSQMLDFVEWVKEWGAENLYIYIEEPKII